MRAFVFVALVGTLDCQLVLPLHELGDGGQGADTGSTAAEAGGGGAGCKTAVFKSGVSTTCQECLVTNCCSEVAACFDDDECTAISSCIMSCVLEKTCGSCGLSPAPPCSCGVSNPGGVTLYESYFSCAQSSCRSAGCD